MPAFKHPLERRLKFAIIRLLIKLLRFGAFLYRNSRFVFMTLGLVAALIFFGAFMSTFQSDFEYRYVVRLGFWFAFCLSYFHFHYAKRRWLTSTTVKIIDYWYLGTASLGIILFAAVYAEQRDQLVDQTTKMLRPMSEVFAKAAVSKQVQLFIADACNEPAQRTAPRLCEKAVEASISLGREMLSAEEARAISNSLKASLQESRKTADGEERNLDRFTSVTVESGSRMVAAIDALVSLEEDMEQSTAAAKEPLQKEMDPLTVFIGQLLKTGHALFWPFFLAAAFALRITKVTIEVFQWDRVTSPLPRLPALARSAFAHFLDQLSKTRTYSLKAQQSLVLSGSPISGAARTTLHRVRDTITYTRKCLLNFRPWP